MSKIVHVDLVDTLMAYMYELEYHVESGDRHSTFYFSVPDEWDAGTDAELQSRVYEVMQQMYSDLNKRFHAAQPDDLGYLRAKSTLATPLTQEEIDSKPWLSASIPAAWEWTPCVVVGEDGVYTRVSPTEFA